jgi:uncharacterized protein (DUF4415 family)
MLDEFQCMECQHKAIFVSPNYEKILCETHKNREKNHQDYFRIRGVDQHLDTLLDKLELVFFDLSTSLAVVEMFLKEQRALKIDRDLLKVFHQRLDKEMAIFEMMFEAGIFLILLNSYKPIL